MCGRRLAGLLTYGIVCIASCSNNDNENQVGSSLNAFVFFETVNLVSDSVAAQRTDTRLVNPWGLDRGPDTLFWVANNGTGTSTFYDTTGVPQSASLTIPTPTGAAGAPTGLVYNGTAEFAVAQAEVSAPAQFIFVTEDGTILGWQSDVTPTAAAVVVDNSAQGAIYKGVAIGELNGKSYLYVANFSGGTVDVFDGSFRPATGFAASAFVDPVLTAGYAPFNVFSSGGLIYVTYAVQDASKEDEVKGPGNGRLNVFNPDGSLVRRIDLGTHANAPWGMADAPSNFGPASGALLIGNFGDGHIYAVDRNSGAFVTDLTDVDGSPIVIDGLWGLRFGNDEQAGSSNALFFTAGPDDEKHGVFGSIHAITQ